MTDKTYWICTLLIIIGLLHAFIPSISFQKHGRLVSKAVLNKTIRLLGFLLTTCGILGLFFLKVSLFSSPQVIGIMLLCLLVSVFVTETVIQLWNYRLRKK